MPMKKRFLVILLLFLFTSTLIINAQSGETTSEPEPILSATPEPLILEPLLGFQTQPPFEITLPEGWELVLRDTFTYQDLVEDGDGMLETLPIDVYRGPVTNADGWIVMLWGYDSLVPFDAELTSEEYPRRAAWLDGLRMLQFVVFDARCNIGTAPQRDYTIGDLPAVGTTFSAVECPFDIPDTRGWFAALNVGGLNFSFFAYADPIQPAGSVVEFELQSILDTVEFNVEDITITQQEFNATQQALVLTPRAEAQIITPTAIPTTSE